jgi:lipoprotein-anchoring transpeptidase ErfK/SrfK
MLARDPEKYGPFAAGMPGGPDNPLGARALYLFDEAGGDTMLRIHGTNDPNTIGTAVSNGCARLTNDDVIALYDVVPTGTVVFLHKESSTLT